MFNDKFVVTNLVSIVECIGKSKTDVFMFSIIEIRDYPHIDGPQSKYRTRYKYQLR